MVLRCQGEKHLFRIPSLEASKKHHKWVLPETLVNSGQFGLNIASSPCIAVRWAVTHNTDEYVPCNSLHACCQLVDLCWSMHIYIYLPKLLATSCAFIHQSTSLWRTFSTILCVLFHVFRCTCYASHMYTTYIIHILYIACPCLSCLLLSCMTGNSLRLYMYSLPTAHYLTCIFTSSFIQSYCGQCSPYTRHTADASCLSFVDLLRACFLALYLSDGGPKLCLSIYL